MGLAIRVPVAAVVQSARPGAPARVQTSSEGPARGTPPRACESSTPFPQCLGQGASLNYARAMFQRRKEILAFFQAEKGRENRSIVLLGGSTGCRTWLHPPPASGIVG